MTLKLTLGFGSLKFGPWRPVRLHFSSDLTSTTSFKLIIPLIYFAPVSRVFGFVIQKLSKRGRLTSPIR